MTDDIETEGYEADRLLRSVCRAFLDDRCSAVLDVILRNHYMTTENDIARVLTGVGLTEIRRVLKELVGAGILSIRTRLPVALLMALPPQRRKIQKKKFERFSYKNQQMQLSEEQESERKRQSSAIDFYYVDYHEAVEIIRFRLYSLLRERSTPVVFSRCSKCSKEFGDKEYTKLFNWAKKCALCPVCREKIVPCGSSKKEDDGNTQQERFLKALQPLISILNIVMKKTFEPFKEYSPEEERRKQEYKRVKEEEKRASAGYVEEVVTIEENLKQPCPGVLSKSERFHNGVIPWLIPSSFFNEDGTPTTMGSKRERNTGRVIGRTVDDLETSPPASKRSHTTDDDDETGMVKSLDSLSEKEIEIIRAQQDFDSKLEYALAKVDELQDDGEMDVVPDTASIRSGSACSTDEQEICSDMDSSSNITSPQQEPAQDQKVLRGFDSDILAPYVVTVAGELHHLSTLAKCDLEQMSDSEYDAYARMVAMIAGVC